MKSNKIKTLDELKEIRDRFASDGKQVVVTGGNFDLVHAGHVDYLQESKTYGDLLIVAVNSDLSIRLSNRINVVHERGRTFVLTGLGCVDYITLFDEPTLEFVLETLKPDVFTKGGDYEKIDKLNPDEVAAVKRYGGEIILAGYDYKFHSYDMVQEVLRKFGNGKNKKF